MANVRNSFENMRKNLELARNTPKGAKLIKKARFKKPSTANPNIYILDRTYEMQYKFLGCGKIKLGNIVEANATLFKKRLFDIEGGFATVLYTDDIYFYENTSRLNELAVKLFYLSEDESYNRASYVYSPVLDAIRNKNSEFSGIKLPTDFTYGANVYMSRIRLDSKMFPKRRIISTTLPLLVLENETPDAMLLPYCFWDDEMLNME